MLRRLASAVVPLAIVATTVVACRHREAAPPPPPPAQPPPPPPPPCGLDGSWQALQPIGPQEIDIVATERQGVFTVRAKNGAQIGSATMASAAGTTIDTNLTNPIYRCNVGPDCNTLTCAFTGGIAPATFKRMP